MIERISGICKPPKSKGAYHPDFYRAAAMKAVVKKLDEMAAAKVWNLTKRLQDLCARASGELQEAELDACWQARIHTHETIHILSSICL